MIRICHKNSPARRYWTSHHPVVGGRAAAGYDAIWRIMAIRPKDLAEFRAYLELLRTGTALLRRHSTPAT